MMIAIWPKQTQVGDVPRLQLESTDTSVLAVPHGPEAAALNPIQ